MSLIHWWPLNGNLKDYGTKNVTLTNSGATSDNSGKIGKCYKLTNTAGTVSRNELDYSTKSISFGGWFKFNQAEIAAILTQSITTSTATTPTGQLFGNDSYGGMALVWSSNNIYSSGSFTSLSVFATQRDANQNKSTTSQTITFDTWYHFMLVWNLDTLTLSFYVNGALKGSQTFANVPILKDLDFILNRNNIYEGNGPTRCIPMRVNDFRCYDHALSLKEVKEISKGLVLHYTFEDAYAEGTTNFNTANWSAHTPYWNINSQVINEIKLTKNTSSSSSTVAIQNNSVRNQITNNTTLTVSGYLIKNGAPYKCASSSMTPYAGWTTTTFESRNDGYFRYTGKFTSIGDSVWIIHTPLFGTCSDGDVCYIKNLQWEIKDHATPYVNGTRQPGLIYDSSGYGRNATPVNNPQILEDSGCGMHCVNLTNAANGYFDLGTATFNFVTNGTVCFWAKYKDSNYKMILGANDSGSKYLAANTPDGSSSNGNWYGRVSTSNCYCDGEVYSKPKIDSQWHFYCFTGINFSSWGDLKYFLCIYANNPNNSFQFHGYLADFKIYSTVLSASDILAEYSRKASIDRNGNLFIGEFNEYQSLAPLELNTTNFTMSSASFSDNNTTITVNGHWAGFQYANANFKYQKYYHLSFDAMYVSGTFLNILGHMANFSPVYWYIDGKKGSVGWGGAPDAVVAEEQVMLDGKWHHFDIYTRYANQNDNYGVWVQVNRTNTSGSAICKFTNLTMEEISSIEYKKAQFPTKRGTVEGLNIIEGFDNTKIGHNATIMANELHEL